MPASPTLIYSNRIEQLYDEMVKKMAGSALPPFAHRILIVPSPSVKTWLMESLACDPRVGTTLGFKIATLEEALPALKRLFSPYTPKRVPHLAELTCAIEGELFDTTDPEVALWLSKNDKRYFYLATELASLFQKYGRFGPEAVAGWQKEIWDRLFGAESPWTYPFEAWSTPLTLPEKKVEIDVFGLTFLSPLEFNFLNNISALCPTRFWILSPCLHFWTDLASEKEKKWLLKKAPDRAVEPLDSLLSDTNPLLANWGKLSRKLSLLLELQNGTEEAAYVVPQSVLDQGGYENYEERARTSSEPATLLRFVQADLLFLRNPRASEPIPLTPGDRSIELHYLPEPLREIQWARELVLRQLQEGIGDILILAPDIEGYIPYIERIFADLPYSVSGKKKGEEEPLLLLLELYRQRFKGSQILKLAQSAGFDGEEAAQIEKWIRQFKIHEEGISSLIFSLVNDKIEISLLELASRWDLFFGKIQECRPQTKASLAEWMVWIEKLPFPIDPDVSAYLKSLAEKIKKNISFQTFSAQVQSAYLRQEEKSGEHGLGQIRFSSLSPMRCQPAEMILLIGMKEGSLPRLDKARGLDLLAPGIAPTKGDFDRSLFLEVLLAAREHFIICWSEREAPSLLVQELIDYLSYAFKGAPAVYKHPAHPHHPCYFEKGTQIPSFSTCDYKAALVTPEEATLSSLPHLAPLQDFEPLPLLKIHELQRLLKNPLEYYTASLGIREREEGDIDEEETLTLNALEIWKTRKRALECKPVLQSGQTLFKQLKSLQARDHHKIVHAYLKEENLGRLMEKKSCRPTSCPYMEKSAGSPPTALSCRGKKSAQEVIRHLPSLLLLNLHDPKKNRLYFLKDQKSVELNIEPLPQLKKLLLYASKAKRSPYPFLPEVIKAFMEGDADKVGKGLSKYALKQSPEELIEAFQAEAIDLFGQVREVL